MNRKKVIPIILITFLALTSILTIPNVTADYADDIMTSNTVSGTESGNTQGALENLHPSATADSSLIAQRFRVTSNLHNFTDASVTLHKHGSPVFTIGAKLNVKSTESGVISSPDQVYTSNTLIQASDIPSTTGGAIVTFDFDSFNIPTDTTKYYALLIYVNASTTIGGANYVDFYLASNTLTGDYVATHYASSAWTNWGSGVIHAIIYGKYDGVVLPTNSPVPTPQDDYKWDENTNSWSWWNGTHWIPSSGPSPTANAQIVTFTGNMITYIVPLCLLLLPAIVGAWALGRAGAAKWGFIAGLNIGAIMCYLYLPSFGLWAVIAIVMVDVVMIFASTRGGD